MDTSFFIGSPVAGIICAPNYDLVIRCARRRHLTYARSTQAKVSISMSQDVNWGQRQKNQDLFEAFLNEGTSSKVGKAGDAQHGNSADDSDDGFGLSPRRARGSSSMSPRPPRTNGTESRERDGGRDRDRGRVWDRNRDRDRDGGSSAFRSRRDDTSYGYRDTQYGERRQSDHSDRSGFYDKPKKKSSEYTVVKPGGEYPPAPTVEQSFELEEENEKQLQEVAQESQSAPRESPDFDFGHDNGNDVDNENEDEGDNMNEKDGRNDYENEEEKEEEKEEKEGVVVVTERPRLTNKRISEQEEVDAFPRRSRNPRSESRRDEQVNENPFPRRRKAESRELVSTASNESDADDSENVVSKPPSTKRDDATGSKDFLFRSEPRQARSPRGKKYPPRKTVFMDDEERVQLVKQLGFAKNDPVRVYFERLTNLGARVAVSLPKDKLAELNIAEFPNGVWVEGAVFNNNIAAHGMDIQAGMELGGYVALIREDGKLDISLSALGSQGRDNGMDFIRNLLKENNGHLSVHDQSSAEDIARTYQMSKRKFKQSVGGLLKNLEITQDDSGIHATALLGKVQE